MDESLIIPLCVAGSVALLVFVVTRLVAGNKDVRITRRLGEINPSASEQERGRQAESLSSKVLLASSSLFTPKGREKQSKLRRQLGQAGIYSASATRLVAGAKALSLFAGLGVGYLAGQYFNNILLGVSLGGLLGYVLPTFWLLQKIKNTKKQLNLSLPDALDLMVVCIEAGLTVDAAMQRVGTELSIAHPALSREFGIAHMETRVGLSRSEALRNLGQRTGAESVQALATMLIQADRFGTSIAQALRVHADSLRVQRQQAAEEMAA